jgi:hypothetical protein
MVDKGRPVVKISRTAASGRLTTSGKKAKRAKKAMKRAKKR